jgi:hypothetical protein
MSLQFLRARVICAATACLLFAACADSSPDDDGDAGTDAGDAAADRPLDAPAEVGADVDRADVTTSADATDVPAPETGDAPADLTSPEPDGGGAPAACRVTSTRTGPFDVTFRLVNQSARILYVGKGCVGIEFSIASCAARFLDNLGPQYTCGCPCKDASCTGTPACAPCPPRTAITIAAGAAVDVPWQAVWRRVEDRGSYACVDPQVLPPAVYSIGVPIYDSATAAVSGGEPTRIVSRTFSLPESLVEVSLAADAPAPTCDVPSPTAPVCAAPFSATTPCALDASYTFGPDGGLTAYTDEAKLTPPNQFDLTRTFRASAEMPQSCRNSLPRCGARHDLFTTADVVEAMAAPDVVAALNQPTPLIYGHDSRPYDGSILRVRRADGRGLDIGSACGPARACARPLTDGIRQLGALLTKVLDQQRTAPGCEALRKP